MKNNWIVILVSTIIFMSIIFCLSDYARIRNANMPMFMILTKSENNQNFYYGLGYKLIRTSNTNFDNISNDVKDEFGLWFYTKEIKIKKPDYVYSINIVENEKTKFEFYFKDNFGFEYYVAGIEKIEIIDGEINNLKEIIQDNKLTMNDIISNFKMERIYSNGKEIYISEENINKPIKVLKDITNKKYYIGPDYINFETIIYEQIVSKKYTVLNLEKTKKKDYIFVTLKDNERDEVDTVKILNSNNYTLLENNNYLFKFIKNEENNDTIESIFNNSTIKEIKLIER